MAVSMIVCLFVVTSSLHIELAAQGSSDAEVQQIAAVLDANGNQVLDDTEIRQAIQIWIGGSTVPDTNLTISDVAILKLIQLWISGQPITAEPPAPPSGSFQIDGIFHIDVDAEGNIITAESSVQTAISGNLIIIAGELFPEEPVVRVDGFQIEVFAANSQGLLTSVPHVGEDSKTVDIVVSDKNNSSVMASTRLTIDPVDVEAIVNPIQIISDFVNAVRAAFAGQQRTDEVDDLMALMDKLENAIPQMPSGESRSIAARIEVSNLLKLLNKSGGVPQSLRPLMDSLFGSFLGVQDLLTDPVFFEHSLGLLPPPRPQSPSETAAPNRELYVSFVVDDFNQNPVEGDPQELTCFAEDPWNISKIKVSIQAGAEAHLIDKNGNPVADLMLERQYSSRERIEAFSIRWNSTVTGQARNVVFTCTAYDGAFFSAKETKTITLTIPIQAAPTSEPEVPDTAPQIINLTAPSMFAGDGQTHAVTVEFEDVNGDLSEVRILTTEGPNAGNPTQTLSLSNVSGLTTGTTNYSISCTNTDTDPFNITQQVVLVDAKGLESDPKTYTYTCEGTGTPEPPPLENTAPTIIDIDAPGFFPGDGVAHEVSVNFADQNKNVNQIKIEITDGPNAGGPPMFDSVPPAADFTGTYHFNVSCDNPSTQFFNVTYRVTITDAGGLESAPKSFAFTCEPTGTP